MLPACLPVETYEPNEFIVTSTGNRISRNATIMKPQNLDIPSARVIIKAKVTLCCEHAPIILHKYTIISSNTKLNPSSTIPSKETTPKHIPLTVGSHSFIGENCVIESAVIGMGCYIGDNCILGPRTVLKDFVCVEPNTYVHDDMVIPPFSVVAGNPAVIVDELPESVTTLVPQYALLRYHCFKQKSDQQES